MRRVLLIASFCLVAACGGPLEESEKEGTSLESVKQRLALFDYNAYYTNYAQDPNYSADFPIYLAANETVMIGTCMINESTYSGDTYLRLYNPSMAQVAYNDQNCGGSGSKLSYTTLASGYYTIRAGCFSSNSCSGTVAISRRKGTFSFSLSNTNYASINTMNKQYYFNAGEYVRVSTCAGNAYGATASGDTYLRLYKQSSGVYNLVAAADGGGGTCGTSAEIVYQISSPGYYQVRAGCAANTACSGTVAVYVE